MLNSLKSDCLKTDFKILKIPLGLFCNFEETSAKAREHLLAEKIGTWNFSK